MGGSAETMMLMKYDVSCSYFHSLSINGNKSIRHVGRYMKKVEGEVGKGGGVSQNKKKNGASGSKVEISG